MRLQREELDRGVLSVSIIKSLWLCVCGYLILYIYIWLIGLALADHPTTDDLSRTIAYDWFSTW